jgi:hypothetical protein
MGKSSRGLEQSKTLARWRSWCADMLSTHIIGADLAELETDFEYSIL